MTWVLACYGFILHLYPQPFQARFAEEMQLVFVQLLEDAAVRGRHALVKLLVNEIPDQLFSLARQHWLVLSGREVKMSGVAGMNVSEGGTVALGNGPAPSWRHALLAGLPHLLVGLVQGLPLLLSAAGWVKPGSSLGSFIMTALGVGLMLAILASLILVWIQSRQGQPPPWAASWYAYWMLGLIIVVVQARNLMAGDDGRSPLADFLVFVVLPLGLAYGLYRAARADRLRGLLAALPVMLILWVATNEFVPDGPEGAVWLAAWLSSALAAALIVRWQRLSAGLTLVLAVVLVTGFAFARNGIYLGGMLPYSEPGPSLKAVLNVYIPMLAVACTVGLGPQLARSLRELGLRGAQHAGRWAYRLSLAGILLALMGVMLRVNDLLNGSTLWAAYPVLRPLVEFLAKLSLSPNETWLMALGLVLYSVGFIFTVNAAYHAKMQPAWPVVLLLYLVVAGIPVCLYFGNAFLGYGLSSVPEVVRNAFELAWIAAAFFSVMHWTLSVEE